MPGKIEYPQTENIQPIIFHYNSDVDWKYTENLGLPLIAYIAGGGHVGLAVSHVMKSLGFHVIIFDHREDVYTLEQNEFADEVIICKYEELGNKIIESERSYVIIVTPMHAGDKDTLKSVINKNVKYIGMMGSKRKIKSIFDALTEEGVDKELLKKVHTPIGIEIEAETPEEIAISIAAEIIKVKNS
jgi:xanthine dehydrogenase accessory factor